MSNADWYARKMGVKPPQQPAQPVHQPLTHSAPQQVPQQTHAPEGEYAPTKAAHLRSQDGNCPDCGSTNYMAPQGTQAAKRCYDCGYPLQQSGSGPSTGLAGGIPTQAAQQLNGGRGNWNPGGFAKGIGIIGRDPSVPTG